MSPGSFESFRVQIGRRDRTSGHLEDVLPAKTDDLRHGPHTNPRNSLADDEDIKPATV
jgi:hypothetical protein